MLNLLVCNTIGGNLNSEQQTRMFYEKVTSKMSPLPFVHYLPPTSFSQNWYLQKTSCDHMVKIKQMSVLAKGPSIYYVHPQGGWVGCCGVYPDVLWWVGGFCLDVHTHHVQRKWIPILVVFLVYSWLSKIHGLLVHFYSLYVADIKFFWYRMQPFYRKITAVQYKLQHIPKKLFKVGGSA